jgi:hypothetical protein
LTRQLVTGYDTNRVVSGLPHLPRIGAESEETMTKATAKAKAHVEDEIQNLLSAPTPAPVATPTPTLDEQLAEVSARYREEEAAARARIAANYAHQVRADLDQYISDSGNERLQTLWGDFCKVATLTAGGSGPVRRAAATSSTGRTRTDKATLTQWAQAIVATVKQSGKNGITASDLRSKLTEDGIDLAARNPGQLVSKFCPTVKLVSQGRGTVARYTIG